jgi:hypothetical protein
MTQTLSREHRRILENTAAQARSQAEAGAEKVLQALAAGAREPPAHASDAEKKLRVRLRAHGRALGDLLRPDDTQAIDHLVTEIAYEHWHRMLFARFLAESDLLMHPDGYPVSLADCKEDAESFNPPARSEWEVAGHYAARMLPNVFRPDSPALALQLPLETEQALEALLAKLPASVFRADDSLGWSYQFWQAPKKEAVQRQMKQAGTKVGADELPAVTQLFTEQYMVAFLLENALGGWWYRRHPRMKLPVELPLTHDMDFDVVSGLELQGFDHRGRQPDGQAVSPFGNLHDVSFDWRYTDFDCISFFSGDQSCTITRDEKKNVLEKAKA